MTQAIDTRDISKATDGMNGMGVRRFGRVNWLGLATLCQREVQRFLSSGPRRCWQRW